MNEDIKILKTIVKIYHNYLQKGEEIDFAINERHLQAIENVLEERELDKKQLKESWNNNLELSKKVKKLETDNKTLKEFASEVFNAEDVSEEYIQKKKIKDVLDDIYDYFERLNVPDEDIEYIESKRKELLEKGANK